MSSNSTENTWVEVSCQRSVARDEYAKGLQDFIWSISSPSVWYPAKSYFRYSLELYGPGTPGTTIQPIVADGLAFAENAVSNSIVNAYAYPGCLVRREQLPPVRRSGLPGR